VRRGWARRGWVRRGWGNGYWNYPGWNGNNGYAGTTYTTWPATYYQYVRPTETNTYYQWPSRFQLYDGPGSQPQYGKMDATSSTLGKTMKRPPISSKTKK
jgi:hypothetical protein